MLLASADGEDWCPDTGVQGWCPEIDLLRRIGLADITESPSALHDWADSMGEDLERCGGPDWLYRCFEKFTELGLLDRNSGFAMGPSPFGRLNLRGRVLLEELAARAD